MRSSRPRNTPKEFLAMTPVKSSMAEACSYDEGTRELTIKMRDDKRGAGESYVYSDVSPEEHAALMDAESFGRHFAQNIRSKSCRRL